MRAARPPTIIRRESQIFFTGAGDSSSSGWFPLKLIHMYTTKTVMRIAPSIRLRPSFPMPKKVFSRPRTTRRAVMKILTGISRFLLDGVTVIGRMSAVRPRIKSVLKILEPTTLPMAISAFPWKAPIKLTTISGADVPMPTMVRPMTNSLRPKRRATEEAPSTSQSAPKTMRASPARSRMTVRIIVQSFFSRRTHSPHASCAGTYRRAVPP